MLGIEMLVTLMVFVDLHFNTHLPVSPFPQARHNGKGSFVMDRPIAGYCRKNLSLLHNGVELLCIMSDMVLRQDRCDRLVMCIVSHDSLICTIELYKDSGDADSRSQVVKDWL